jgi:hypothetical protein
MTMKRWSVSARRAALLRLTALSAAAGATSILACAQSRSFSEPRPASGPSYWESGIAGESARSTRAAAPPSASGSTDAFLWENVEGGSGDRRESLKGDTQEPLRSLQPDERALDAGADGGDAGTP